MIVTIVIFIIIGFIVSRIINGSREDNNKLDEEPFGKKFKTLIDELATNLWEEEKYILMKKSNRQYIIQKSKTYNFESHIYVIYRVNTLYLEYYEKSIGVEIKFKKTYNILNITTQDQIELAKNFSNQVYANGKMMF